MVKSIIGWLLATASVILGILWFFGVLTFFPLGPGVAFIGQVLHGLGWIFGTALPRLGTIILDRLQETVSSGPPTTTTIP